VARGFASPSMGLTRGMSGQVTSMLIDKRSLP